MKTVYLRQPPVVRYSGVSQAELLTVLKRRLVQAQNNASRQRIRLLNEKPCRIFPAYWEALAAGLLKTIAKIRQEPATSKYTVEEFPK